MSYETTKKILGLASVVIILVALATGGVLAGDARLSLLFDPDMQDASAGDSVEIQVMGQTDGGYDGTGVGSVEFDVRYDPEAVSVTDVERGTWLEGSGTETTVYTDGDEDGYVSVDQERESDQDGVTGYGSVVVLTLELEEDLEPSDVVLEFDNANAHLSDGHPLFTFERTATVTVDGGGDEREPPSGEIDRHSDDEAEEIDEGSDRDDGTDENGTADQSDDMGGFGILAATVAFGVISLHAFRSRTH